jgi:hypothetical protein
MHATVACEVEDESDWNHAEPIQVQYTRASAAVRGQVGEWGRKGEENGEDGIKSNDKPPAWPRIRCDTIFLIYYGEESN